MTKRKNLRAHPIFLKSLRTKNRTERTLRWPGKYCRSALRELIQSFYFNGPVEISSSAPSTSTSLTYSILCQEDGAVLFPQNGEGIYMVDDALAMIEWCEHMPRRVDGIVPSVEFKGAREFIPGNDEQPFAFIQDCSI
jgi:hypothetical protein